ncbi:MAG: hypothetical protein WCF04_15305, partial [Candidatus Nanopelagicales bacterium]
ITVRYGNAAGVTPATWSGRAIDPPPTRAWLSDANGDSVTINFQSYEAGRWLIRCWAANTYAEHNWKVDGYNFGGEVGTRSVPATGQVRVTCPDPLGVVNAGGPLSLELVGKDWIGPITVS